MERYFYDLYDTFKMIRDFLKNVLYHGDKKTRIISFWLQISKDMFLSAIHYFPYSL